MSKRTSSTYFTPPSNTGKTRVLESTSNLSGIIQQLSQQLPENDLIKQLQGAFENHMQQIHSLLETVINLETPEEKERKRSLVFIGLTESTEPKASDRVDADNKAVKEVLDLLDVGAPPSVVYRMGHPDPNRFPDRPRKGPRVLKVVMPSSQIQRQVLAALKNGRKKLKESAKFSRCIVRPSMTPEEREMDKKAQEELKRRKQAGEKNLFIKNHKVYSNDVMSGDF